MADSRTKNTMRNVVAGLINQGVSIILPFVNRTIILWTLGAEFTGLSGLFSSILSVLGIAELGFNTAIVYSLYRPMAEHDEHKICEIVSLFRKIYRIIGTIVLVLGIMIMPFLKYLIKGSYPNEINLYIIYFLYLLNSVISYYMFAYKECLLIADQRNDLAQNVRTIINILRYLAQFVVLLVFHNFYEYLVVAIIGTMVTNLGIQWVTLRKYPYFKQIHEKQQVPIELIKQIKGLMTNKICDTFRNSFDSVIISSFIGLRATAIYGNYYYIYSAIYGIMLTICNAMSASVGNSIVEKNEKQNYENLLTFSALFALVLGVCTSLMACLYQPFMKLWAGDNLLLSTGDMLLFCIYFYVINMNNIRNQYISGTGIWWKLKASYIMEAVANLLLNFILGKYFGITGVLLATIITIFVFNYLQRNAVLFKSYFKNSKYMEFLVEQIYFAFIALVAIVCSYVICAKIGYNNSVLTLFVKGCLTVIVTGIILLFGLLISKRRQSVITFMRQILNHRKLVQL